MFFLGMIYLIVLVVAGLSSAWNDPRVVRLSGFAQWILFVIIGFVLFYKELNR